MQEEIQDGWEGNSHADLSCPEIWKEQKNDHISRGLIAGNFKWRSDKEDYVGQEERAAAGHMV